MKDYYEPWIFATHAEICGSILVAAIRATFERRETPIPTEIPMGLTAEFTEDQEKVRQWRAFAEKIETDPLNTEFDRSVRGRARCRRWRKPVSRPVWARVRLRSQRPGRMADHARARIAPRGGHRGSGRRRLRRERLPRIPETWDAVIAPDWVCETMSDSTRDLDLNGKRPVYAREGISHLWLVDPTDRALEAFELHEGQWLQIANAKDDEPVNIRPFDAITFSLGNLWP